MNGSDEGRESQQKQSTTLKNEDQMKHWKRRRELSMVGEVRKGNTRLKQTDKNYMSMVREFGMTQRCSSKVGQRLRGMRKGVCNIKKEICSEPSRSCFKGNQDEAEFTKSDCGDKNLG